MKKQTVERAKCCMNCEHVDMIEWEICDCKLDLDLCCDPTDVCNLFEFKED